MEPERPLRLDATREEALAHAAKLVEEAWRSFDRFRPEEPPLDARVRELIRGGLPEEPAPVHEVLDDAARILDESIAQPRPRYFAFIGSSGLEIGAIADLLAHTYDINLAVDARAATVRRTAGGPVAGGVRRLPGGRRRVHERGDDQQPHRDRGGARAGAPGISPRRSRRAGVRPSIAPKRSITR